MKREQGREGRKKSHRWEENIVKENRERDGEDRKYYLAAVAASFDRLFIVFEKKTQIGELWRNSCTIGSQPWQQ